MDKFIARLNKRLGINEDESGDDVVQRRAHFKKLGDELYRILGHPRNIWDDGRNADQHLWDTVHAAGDGDSEAMRWMRNPDASGLVSGSDLSIKILEYYNMLMDLSL